MKKLRVKLISFILIEAIIFSILQIFFINTEVNADTALSSTYTQYVTSGISSFPESYQKLLAYLKYLHPNWEFKAYYTGIDWNELTSSSAENACLKNTIYFSSSSSYIMDPLVLCTCGQTGDTNYYCASAKAVNYYLDPRNFLDEAMIFQFLDLSSGSEVSRSAVYSAVQGTYLEQYTDVIMTAATEAGINPLHIVATIFQELGTGSSTPAAITGTYSGYEGYYNFYNYGATDGSGATSRAMAKAKELKWDSAEKALIEGAKTVLANNYILAGQTTKYFYKFDVVGNEILTESMGSKTYSSSYFFSHQYMTNLRDPSSQAGSLYDMYVDSEILDENLTFIIPVYDNMPTEAVSAPTTLTSSDGELYYINTLKNGSLNIRSSADSTNSLNIIGQIFKNAIVAVTEYGSSWCKVTYCTATSYSNGTWNYEKKTGYIATGYLTKVGTEIPDYRDKVDMSGSGSAVDVIEIEITDSGGIYVTPAVTVSDIIAEYPNAVIVKADGTDISSTSEAIPTGAKVTINGETYTVVKLGDVNGDADVDVIDLALVKRYLTGKTTLTDEFLQAGILQDGNTDVDVVDLAILKRYLMGTQSITL